MSTPLAPAAHQSRLHALDGLRGVAAVSVFFFHSSLLQSLPAWLNHAISLSPLGALFNGPGAVHVFFVLSGYVLSLTLATGAGAARIPRYYVRRWFRIHPPYMVAVLVTFALVQAILSFDLENLDLRLRPIPASKLPVALAFPSMAFGLLPVGWSLFIELAMSVVFPLLFFLARTVHPAVPLAVSFLFLGEIDPRFQFLRFTIDFALGLLLCFERDAIAARLRTLPRATPAMAAAVGLVLLQLPLASGLASDGLARLEQGHTPFAVVVFAVSASLLVIGALHAPGLERVLSRPVARYFGRISYSFYLVHYSVLVGLSALALPWAGTVAFNIGVTAVGFVASVAMAELGWRCVEAPSIRMGRALIRAGDGIFARALPQ